MGVALLIPPWVDGRGALFGGFGFLFLHEYDGDRARISVSLLIAEALFIALGTAGAVVALHKKADN